MSRSGRINVLKIASFALVLIGTAAVASGEWWWPPTLTVQPANPTTADPVVLKLSGEWPDSCIPNDSHAWPPVGWQIPFDLIWDYPPDVFCADVITPWSRAETLAPLAAGTYDVWATLYRSFDGSIWMGPTKVGTFTVSQVWQPGDMNCDQHVNFADIDPFVLALGGEAGYLAQFPDCRWLNADCNGDGAVDFADIDPFVALLSGGGPHLKDYAHSDCLRGGWPCEEDDAFVLTVEGDTLDIVHQYATYNCCPEEILVSLEVQGDLLKLTETEINPQCDCICCFEVYATVAGLDPGTYTVEYWWFDYDAGGLRYYTQQIIVP